MKFLKLGFAAAAAALLIRSTIVPSVAEETMQAAVSQPDAKAQPELATHGQELYAHHCSHCHGFNMVNAGTIAFDLRKFPHDNKARFVNSVTNGKNNRMPPWGDLLTKDEIDCLWAYVSSYNQP